MKARAGHVKKKAKQKTIVSWIRAAFTRNLPDDKVVAGVKRAFPKLRDPRQSCAGYLAARRAGRKV